MSLFTALVLCSSLVTGTALAQSARRAAPGKEAPATGAGKVALLRMKQGATIAPAAQSQLRETLEQGLRKGLGSIALLDVEQVAATLPAELAACASPGCMPQVSQALAARVLVVAEAAEELGTYSTALRAYDGLDGSPLHEGSTACEICTLDEAGRDLEKTAARFGHELAKKIAELPPPPPSSTRVRVVSMPSGAGILLDGKKVGTAPLETDLLPGKYLFSVEKDGFLPSERILEVKASPLVVEFRLKQKASTQPVTAAGGWDEEGDASGGWLDYDSRYSTYAYAGLGLGLASVALGGVLLGLDGEPTCDGPLEECPTLYDTGTAGIIGTAVGGGMMVGAAMLFLIDQGIIGQGGADASQPAAAGAAAAPRPEAGSAGRSDRLLVLPAVSPDGGLVLFGAYSF